MTVMYFSTSILSPVFPLAKLVAVYIVLLKIPLTILPAFLLKRGTRPLLIVPTGIMALSLIMLGFGLDASIQWLAIVGITLFVSFFSIGLGPIPWIVLATAMPPHARAATSTIGQTINWSTNFIVGAAFLPLQSWLASVGGGQGSVFYVFAAACAAAALAMREGYRRLDG